MAFMLPALGGLLGSFLFKKKGGQIVKQVPTGQVFVQPKKDGGSIFNMTPEMLKGMTAPLFRKKGGKVAKKRGPKPAKKTKTKNKK